VSKHAKPKPTVVTRAASKAVPTRRALILLETGLILGLTEGIMNDAVTHISISPYLKALLLMAGVIGAFAFALRVIEPVIKWALKVIAKVEAGGGPLVRIGLHLVIIFLIYVAYVRVFFHSVV
jgi:hypothetical protein